MKTIVFSLFGTLLGVGSGLAIIIFFPFFNQYSFNQTLPHPLILGPKHIIGFLPYWLLEKAQPDYSKNVTTLSYFALRISPDGTIQKRTTPTQDEPGWYALTSGKADKFLQTAKANNVQLSLTLDSGDTNAINSFLASSTSAKNLVSDTLPLMEQYGFSDLNLDIEYTQEASSSSRLQFTKFIKAVRDMLPKQLTLTLEISPVDAIQQHLIDIQAIAPFAEHIVLMAYDYHAPDSFVTGPVAPLFGAGTESEYDVATATTQTLRYASPTKLILGIPLYGYEWETLGAIPRSAVIPGSGVLASSQRVATFLSSCASCSATLDSSAQESYISYFNNDTDTNHLIFYPDLQSTASKIDFAKKNGLAGIALWALGYEDTTILNPVSEYKNNY